MVDIFKSIQIQTIYKCNLKCDFCPNSYIKQTGEQMKWKLFYKIIDNLKNIGFKGTVKLYLMNEPLLDDRLLKMVKYTKCQLPDNEIMISTNGVLLKEDKLNEFLKNGLNKIIVSCYTEYIYNKVKDWKVSPIKFYERDLQKQFYNRGGNSKNYGGKIEQKYCKNPFEQMYITSNGKALLCCADYRRKVVMGNVDKQDLIEIWNGKKYNYYRSYLQQGIRKNLKLCKNCNY